MLAVTVANLGPIRQSYVVLEPLTVFVGPNNSGKSFLATVIYAALSGNNASGEYELSPWDYPTYLRLGAADSEALIQFLASEEPPEPGEIPPRVAELASHWFEEALYSYGRGVIRALERGFGATATELRRSAPSVKSVKIAIEDLTLGWRVTISVGTRSTRAIVSAPEAELVLASMDRAAWRRLRTRVRGQFGPERTGRPGIEPRTAGLVRGEMLRALMRNLGFTLYMPAARSGLMQSQRAIAGAVVRRASLAGIEDVRVPALSGVVADFLSRMITLTPHNGGFAKEADRLEQDVLHGHVSVVNAPGGFPEIMYTTSAGMFPIHRTSSMISELAPVVLMLRAVLDPGETLIIEEPEAHLHPGSQIAFAASLARLVNRDLRVVLTTHSEFFLQQLNNAIMASDVGKTVATQVGLRSERLHPSRVGAYLFEPGDNGTHVRQLAISRDEGIPESSFAYVAEALYNQSVALDRASRRG